MHLLYQPSVPTSLSCTHAPTQCRPAIRAISLLTRGHLCAPQPSGERRRLALQVELKALGLWERQAAVRVAVESTQDIIMQMTDKNYKKYVRFAVGQRLALLKQVRCCMTVGGAHVHKIGV